MIFWKGKGILIFLYFIATLIVFGIVNALLKEYFDFLDNVSIKVFLGIILFVTGIWTKLTAEDSIIDKKGRKIHLDIENELYFIKMKTWGIILPAVGGCLVVYGIVA